MSRMLIASGDHLVHARLPYLQGHTVRLVTRAVSVPVLAEGEFYDLVVLDTDCEGHLEAAESLRDFDPGQPILFITNDMVALEILGLGACVGKEFLALAAEEILTTGRGWGARNVREEQKNGDAAARVPVKA